MFHISEVIGGSCSANSDCTGTVSNSECQGGSTCVCAAGYKANGDSTSCTSKSGYDQSIF